MTAALLGWWTVPRLNSHLNPFSTGESSTAQNSDKVATSNNQLGDSVLVTNECAFPLRKSLIISRSVAIRVGLTEDFDEYLVEITDEVIIFPCDTSF